MSKIKAVITGAHGSLGSNIISSLKESNFDVYSLRLKAHLKFEVIYNGQSSFIEGMIGLKDFLKDKEHVIHSATCYGRKNESLDEMLLVNVNYPTALLECLGENSTFINIDTALPENVSNYALTKSLFRSVAKSFCYSKKNKIMNLRLQILYSCSSRLNDLVSMVIRKCLQNEKVPLTDGKSKRDFIFAEDVISALKLILNYKSDNFFEEFELGGGHSQSIRSVVETIHDFANSNSVLEFGAIPTRPNEPENLIANIEKLKSLGWTPKTDIKEGIKKIILWQKKFL